MSTNDKSLSLILSLRNYPQSIKIPTFYLPSLILSLTQSTTNKPAELQRVENSMLKSIKQLERIERKKQRHKLQREIITIAKKAIKPSYKKHYITKDDYKIIMKKVVTKATYSNRIDQQWINKNRIMFFIIFFIILSCLILFKFRDRLAFQHGRLTRSYDRTSTKPITQMGSDQFIELSFGIVHYIYRPSSSSSSLPLNIFVHGYATPMEMWQDIFQSLVKDNQPCLVYDLYGRGWSDCPFVPMNIDIFVCQLAELLYALNLPYEKYNLFGVSMGGAIIQRFTELYPTRIEKLILCCSAGIKLNKPSKFLMLLLSIPILGPMAFKYVMTHGNEKQNRLEWTFPGSEIYENYKKLFQSSWQQHPGYLRALFSTLMNFDFESSSKSIEFISKLNLPILIIWGDKDPLIPIENAYRYNQLYKNSILKIIPDATHMLLLEHSKPIIDAIRIFLKQ